MALELLEPARSPMWVAYVAALCSTALVISPAWVKVRVVVTVFHELGHALAALVVGATVERLHLNVDSSGHTTWTFPGRPGRLRRAVVAWCGYPAPPLVGVSAAWSLHTGRSVAFVAALAVVATLALVLWVRNLWALAVVAALASACALATITSVAVTVALCSALGSLCLVGGWRASLEHVRGRHGDHGSDSRVVSSALVVVPAIVVRFSFLVAAGLSCALAARLLTG